LSFFLFHLLIVFEYVFTSPDVKYRLFFRNDGLGEVEDTLLLIFFSLNEEDSLLTAEQGVRCPVTMLVDNDQLVVFRGEKDVGL
jgi:hypothetical protein